MNMRRLERLFANILLSRLKETECLKFPRSCSADLQPTESAVVNRQINFLVWTPAPKNSHGVLLELFIWLKRFHAPLPQFVDLTLFFLNVPALEYNLRYNVIKYEVISPWYNFDFAALWLAWDFYLALRSDHFLSSINNTYTTFSANKVSLEILVTK